MQTGELLIKVLNAMSDSSEKIPSLGCINTYTVLLHHYKTTGEPFRRRLDDLAKMAGISPRSLDRTLNSLEDFGLIKRTKAEVDREVNRDTSYTFTRRPITITLVKGKLFKRVTKD